MGEMEREMQRLAKFQKKADEIKAHMANLESVSQSGFVSRCMVLCSHGLSCAPGSGGCARGIARARRCERCGRQIAAGPGVFGHAFLAALG